MQFKNRSQGIAHPLVVVVVLAALIGGIFTYWQNFKKQEVTQAHLPTVAGANNQPCTPGLVVGASETHKTLDAAITALNNNGAGKVICIKNDKTYGPVAIIKVSGSAGAPLVIKGHPDNPVRSGTKKPIFRDETAYPKWQERKTKKGKTPIILRGNNIVLQDVEIARSADQGLDVGGSADNDMRENLQVINVTVHDTYGDGIRVLYAKNVTVDGCELYRNEMVGTVTDCMNYPNAQCPIGEVLKVRHSDTVTVQNCSIREDMSRGRGGILNTDSKNTTYRNNEIYMNTGNLLHIGDASNVVMENNLVYATCGDKANGLYKLAERYPPTAKQYKWKGGSNYTIRNNVIVGMAKGLNFGGCEGYVEQKGSTNKIWPEGHPCPFDNVLVERNTIVGTGNQNSQEDETKEYSLVISDMHGDPVSNVRIRNNIMQSVEDGTGNHEDVLIQARGDVSFSGNVFHDRNTLGSGDVEVPNLTGVFSGNPNLNACITGRIDLNKYRVSNAYNGKGADISKVGRFALDGEDEENDSDGDGILDAEDVCPNTPAGSNPDPDRLGCPIDDDPPTDDDRDNDGILNDVDLCPDTPAGQNPDPDRLGCPLVEDPSGENVISNPGFRLPATQQKDFALNWTFTHGKLGSARAEIVKAGNGSLGVREIAKLSVLQAPPLGYPTITQKNIDMEPTTTYNISFVARASQPTRLLLSFRDMGYVQNTLAPEVNFNLGNTWQSYEGTVRTSNYNPNKAVQLFIGFMGATGSNLLIDNIRIAPAQ